MKEGFTIGKRRIGLSVTLQDGSKTPIISRDIEDEYTQEEEKHYKDFMTLKGRQISKSTSFGRLVARLAFDKEFAEEFKRDVINNYRKETLEKK